MPLLNLAIVIILIGVLLWAINRFIPMNQSIKNILNFVVISGLVIWLLNSFGLLSFLSNIKIPKIK